MWEILAAFLLTLCILTGVMLRYAPFKAVLSAKQKLLLFILYALIIAVNMLGLTWSFLKDNLTASLDFLRYSPIFYAAVLLLVNALVIRNRIREHIFVSGIVINFNYLLMTVPNFVIALVPKLAGTHILYVIVIIYTALLLLTYWPLRMLLSNTVTPFLYLETDNYWSTIWFIPIAFFGARYINLGGSHDAGNVQQLFSSVLSCTLIILMCLSIAKSHKTIYQKQRMTEQLTEQKLHYMEMQTRVQNARQNRHDMKHHIAAIRRYIELDDKSGLSEYCDAFVQRNQLDKNALPYTGNVAVDGVVYKYMQLCEEQNIQFSCLGTVRSDSIADIDICVLIGNVLENAFTACLTIPEDRYIKMISKSEKNLLTVIVTNSFDGKLRQGTEGVLLSRKREGRTGVGMKSMESVCQRYGGTMEKHWDDNTFTLMFMLPIP